MSICYIEIRLLGLVYHDLTSFLSKCSPYFSLPNTFSSLLSQWFSLTEVSTLDIDSLKCFSELAFNQ